MAVDYSSQAYRDIIFGPGVSYEQAQSYQAAELQAANESLAAVGAPLLNLGSLPATVDGATQIRTEGVLGTIVGAVGDVLGLATAPQGGNYVTAWCKAGLITDPRMCGTGAQPMPGVIFPSLDDFMRSTGVPFPGAGIPSVLSLPGSPVFPNFGDVGRALLQQVPTAGTIGVNVNACPPGKTLRKSYPKPRISPVTGCVPRRHMNMANPKALRRATSRMRGFFNLAKSAEKAVRHAFAGTGVIPKKSGGKRGTCFTCRQPRAKCAC